MPVARACQDNDRYAGQMMFKTRAAPMVPAHHQARAVAPAVPRDCADSAVAEPVLECRPHPTLAARPLPPTELVRCPARQQYPAPPLVARERRRLHTPALKSNGSDQPDTTADRLIGEPGTGSDNPRCRPAPWARAQTRPDIRSRTTTGSACGYSAPIDCRFRPCGGLPRRYTHPPPHPNGCTAAAAAGEHRREPGPAQSKRPQSQWPAMSW